MESLRKVSLFLILVVLWETAHSLDNGLARTPPMGWLSWERFLCNVDCKRDPANCISERLYMDQADRLAADGYKEAGYEYVNIDDCWMSKQRDANGRLQPDPERFPSGIKALADYVHSKGLKLGIYQDCGTKTCAGYPGSSGYFEIDAQTYADWGVDMLKLDGCNSNPKDMDKIYPAMTQALNETGRPMVFSCSWPDYQRGTGIKPKYQEIAKNCNLWRNFDDIGDSWNSVKSIIDYYASVQDDLIPAAGPGNWNDPDMLIIGNFGLSLDQAQTQMAIWSILAAPLLMSNDLRNIRQEFKDILLNKDIIAINQDPLGLMGKKIHEQSQIAFWIRPVIPIKANSTPSSTSFAIAVSNRRESGTTVAVTLKLSSLGLTDTEGYKVYDLYQNRHFMGHFLPNDDLNLQVNPSGVVMLKAEVGSAGNSVLK